MSVNTLTSGALRELVPMFAAIPGFQAQRFVEVLAGYTANCIAEHLHRGTLTIEQVADAGRRDATLTVVKHPNKPQTWADQEPTNGPVADFGGLVRIRGWLQLDQGIIGAGGIANFEQLLALFPVGFQMPWHDETDIPTGWAIMDGTANSVGNGGSGINKGGRVDYGYISGDPTFGTLGAMVAISLASSISGDGTTVSTSTAGVHGHNISGSEIGNAISISAHAASSGGTTVATDIDFWLVNDSPTGGNEAFDGTNADATFSSSLGDVNEDGHYHTILKSQVVAALADHSVTDTMLSAETDSTGDHSHTSNINTIAGKLSIGTPTTVRPPGIVTLWIEKLA